MGHCNLGTPLLVRSWPRGRRCKNCFLIHHLFHSKLLDSHSIQFSDPNQIVFVSSESNLVFWLQHQVLLDQDYFLQQTHSIFHLPPTKMIFEFLTDRLLKFRVTSQFTKSFSLSLPESRKMKLNSGQVWPKRFGSYSGRVIFLYLFLAVFLCLTRRLLRFKYLIRLRDNRILRENKLILPDFTAFRSLLRVTSEYFVSIESILVLEREFSSSFLS